MAKSRGGGGDRRGVNIWPSFVDALSTLVLVIVFALMIFVIAQQVLSNALDDTERSRSALSARVSALANQLDAAQSENSRLGASIASLRTSADAAQDALELARDELALTRIRNNELLSQLGETTANRQSLEAERSGNRALIARLRSQIADLDQLSNTQDAEIGALSRRNMELLAMLDQSEESDRDRAETVRALEETRAELRDSLASSQALMLDVQARLASLLQSYGELEGTNEETALLLSQDTLRDSLTSGVNATSALYDRITQLVASTQIRLETLLRARDEALARFEQARQQAEQNRIQLVQTSADLDTTISLLDQSQTDLAAANLSLNDLSNANSDSNRALEQLQQRLQNEIANRDAKIQVQDAEIQAFQLQLFDASSQIAELLAREENQASRMKTLEDQRAAVDQELIAAYERISASEAEVSVLAADLDNFSRLRNILEEQVEALRAERSTLQTQLDVTRQASNDLGVQLSSAISELDLLRDGASQLEASNSAVETTLREVLNQLEDTEQQRNLAIVSAQEAQLLREQDGIALVEASSRIEALETQISQLSASLDTATRRTQSDQRRIIGQTEEITVLETRLTNLEVSLALAEKVDELIDYRSEFFGTLSRALESRNEVQLVDERFILPSEVLFASGAATLSPEGRNEVSRIGTILADIAQDIPEQIDWILRIDGHTDVQPVTRSNPFGNNWRLSTERALAVSNLLIGQGFPANRLAVTGFGEHQPLVDSTSPAALRQNRRIELRLVQR